MTSYTGNQLAIVIPAYKVNFFKKTLESICDQTNKNFTVYIGDDCSHENFSGLIDLYKDKVNIVYKRFNENMGGTNLVAQWHRCIRMIDNERWVWLFSDDDVMHPRCVEAFYKALGEGANYNLYHFNVIRIDGKNNVVFEEKPYPPIISGIDFIKSIINFNLRSYAIEYIFDINQFNSLGGFENFDLAWGSDHATWLKLSFSGLIKTIPGATVQWRSSGYNITSIDKDKELSKRKRNAELKFYQWLVGFFHAKSIPFPVTNHSANRWFVQGLIAYIEHYGLAPLPGWINEFSEIKGKYFQKLRCYFYLAFYITNRKLKQVKKNKF